MPSISGTFDQRSKQIIIRCGIVESGYIRNFVSQQNDPKKAQKIVGYYALIDTGANTTAISSKIVKDLNLQHHSITQSSTANGIVETNIYDVDLLLGFSNHQIAIEKLRVIEAKLPSSFDILLGMDVILGGQFHISHDHHFTFSI